MIEALVSVRKGLPAVALLLFVSLIATACDAGVSAAPTGAVPPIEAQASQPIDGEDDVLATIDGEEITLADLLDQIGERLGLMDFQYNSQRHQLIEETMKQFVRDQLIAAEAETRGVTAEALIAEVLGDQVDVTEDDVRMFYIQNQSALGGRTYETIAPQIRTYLEDQIRTSVLEDFASELADEHDVDYRLGPFRVALDLTGAPVYGNPDAPITLVEFSDFECPYCRSFLPTLEQIKAEYPDEVRIVFKQFPLNEIHPKAQKAAEASLCAHEQGMFWETHDLYFTEQDRLDVPDLQEKAARLGLDTDQFNACLASEKYVDVVDADVRAGAMVGVNGTPAVFVNGRPLPGGAVPFQTVAEVIEDELDRLGR